jgi:hypothetical protein
VLAQGVPATEQEFQGVSPIDPASLLEQLAEWDEEALDRWVTGELLEEWSRQRLQSLSKAGAVFPVLFGASLKGIGMRELVDGVAGRSRCESSRSVRAWLDTR